MANNPGSRGCRNGLIAGSDGTLLTCLSVNEIRRMHAALPRNRDKPYAAMQIIHSGAVSARNPVGRSGKQNGGWAVPGSSLGATRLPTGPSGPN